jgi:hypothetical protein
MDVKAQFRLRSLKMNEVREVALRIHRQLMNKSKTEGWSKRDREIWKKLCYIVLHSKEFDVS